MSIHKKLTPNDLVEKYYATLLAFTISLCKRYKIDPLVYALDLLHDAFIKIVDNDNKINQIEDEGAKLKYIYSIIRNHLIDQLRRSNKMHYDSEIINDRNEHIGSLDHLLVENQDLLKFIFSILSPKEQLILELYLSGLKYQEIGEEMRIPKNTVGVAILRIRDKIKKQVKDWK